jgi:1,2-diacylglycerol 3-beta-galactosyltransferase
LTRLDPTVQVTSFDPLIAFGPAAIRRLTALYSPIIRRSRLTWGAIYHGSNTGPAWAAIRRVFGPGVRQVLAQQLRSHDPDLVISVHPLLNHVGWQAIQMSGRPRGLVTVVTDLVEFHRGWIFPRVDLLVVPTESARLAALKRRVPADRVRLLGLPVDLRFRPPAPGEKLALRRRYGLDEDRFSILISGGGEGSGKLLQQARALAWLEHPWQVVVVCGRNEKLQRRLSRVRFGTPTRIFGFVDDMPDLMRAADVVVSKAGPGAIGEVLATGLPLIVTGYLPGQETENVTFVSRSGFGRYAPKPDQLLQAVTDLTAENGRLCREMSEKAAEIARPYASIDIARACLDMAEAYRAASQASA